MSKYRKITSASTALRYRKLRFLFMVDTAAEGRFRLLLDVYVAHGGAPARMHPHHRPYFSQKNYCYRIAALLENV